MEHYASEPWFVKPQHSTIQVRSEPYGLIALVASSGTHGNPYTDECVKAHAALIAAAPDLYRELSRILAYLQIHDSQYYEGNADALKAQATIYALDTLTKEQPCPTPKP